MNGPCTATMSWTLLIFFSIFLFSFVSSFLHDLCFHCTMYILYTIPRIITINCSSVTSMFHTGLLSGWLLCRISHQSATHSQTLPTMFFRPCFVWAGNVVTYSCTPHVSFINQSINQNVDLYSASYTKFTEAPVSSGHAQKAADLRLDLKPYLLMSLFFSSEDGRSFHTDGALTETNCAQKRDDHVTVIGRSQSCTSSDGVNWHTCICWNEKKFLPLGRTRLREVKWYRSPKTSHSKQIYKTDLYTKWIRGMRWQWTHPTLIPAEQAGTRFTYPRGMEGWVDLGDWLHNEMVHPPADDHPSKY